MHKPISTRTSTAVIRPGRTERRHRGNGTRVPARINEAGCASPTPISIAVMATKRHVRPRRQRQPRPDSAPQAVGKTSGRRPHDQPLAPSPGGAFLCGTTPRARNCSVAEDPKVIPQCPAPRKARTLGPRFGGAFSWNARLGHVSLCQLLANACMAASRVASYPCVGVRSS
jgi:hypothetical protein